MTAGKRLWAVAGLALLSAGAAPAYYHFLQYLSRTGPFVGIPSKFDVNALPNKTVSFYISEQGPTALAPDDSFAGVVSQIRLAARMWNDVETSDLRVTFGGLFTPGTAQSGPGIEVLFTDDIPPGLVALGGPTARADTPAVGPNGPFIPITRSVVMVRRDLTNRPSYSEGFFLTLTHELGHALGLQHTLTSSVMSTEITRSTTKAKPLAADDAAGISLLYPVRGYLASTGSVSGRVTLGGTGVGLASVVAITPNGPAISTLTHPDGSYRIDGLPPGSYFIYAHPLPPAFDGEASPANIVLPLGPDGRPFPVGPLFDTVFFPGTKEPQFSVPVAAAGLTENVNFNVQRRNNVPVYAVQTYGFIGQVTTKPPLLSRTGARGTLVAAGMGLFGANNTLSPGLGVNAIGGATAVVPGSLRPYPFAASYAQMDIAFAPFVVDGPQHLLFSQGGDIYVLPAAFQVTQKQPPSIASVTSETANGARLAAISGSNLGAETRFLFDGQPGTLRSFDEFTQRALVVPPRAAPGHRAHVVALNPDGQSSLFAQGNNLPLYNYDPGEGTVIAVTPNALPAGSEAMVEISAINGNFQDGQTRIGFGSSDILVRRLWVAGPNRLLANVAVAGNATPGAILLTVSTGLQVISQPNGFQMQTANPRQVIVYPQALNPVTGSSSITAGSTALLFAGNLPAGTTPASLSLTLNDQPVQILSLNNGQITFQVPAGLAPGPAVIRLRVGAETALPVVLAIDPPPPVIIAVQSSTGLPVDATRPARVGDQIALLVAGLVGDAPVTIGVNGVEHTAQQVSPAAQAGVSQVVFFLAPGVSPGTHPMTVSQDGRVSGPVSLPVR